MKIILIPIGNLDAKSIEALKKPLNERFGKDVVVGRPMPLPKAAYDANRAQWIADELINSMLGEAHNGGGETKLLGVLEEDIYTPDLNFVFGVAERRAAVISLARLRQSFYSLPEDNDLFFRRMLTEAVHELGHSFGLRHCLNPHCVMYFSSTIIDTDIKGADFCAVCRQKIGVARSGFY